MFISDGWMLWPFVAFNLLPTFLGVSEARDHHSKRHEHSATEITLFSETSGPHSFSMAGINRSHNKESYGNSQRNMAKVGLYGVRSEKNYPRIFAQMNGKSLRTKNSFLKNKETLNFGESHSNSNEAESETNFFLASEKMRVLQRGRGIGTQPPNNTKFQLDPPTPMPISFKEGNEVATKSYIITTINVNSKGAYPSKVTKNKWNRRRNERAVVLRLPQRNFADEKVKIHGSSISKARISYLNLQNHRPRKSSPPFKISSHLEDRAESSSMFMEHNITVESLNPRIDTLTKTNSENGDQGFSSKKEADFSWNVSFIEGKSNLNNTSTRIYAQAGGDALLPCRVGHLGDRQVSWIRRRDWFVLTSGHSLYSHDERFSVLHEQGSQDWTLHIKRTVPGDAGLYECQVSTGTGIISFFVRLQIVTPKAQIPGNGHLHVYRGSPFTIYCYILKSSSVIQHAIWHQNGVYLSSKGENKNFLITTKVQKKVPEEDSEEILRPDLDYQVEVEKNPEENVVVSWLKVDFATESHSGNYTCSAPNVVPDSIKIYVNDGDKTAAVQRIHAGSASSQQWSSFRYIILFIVLCKLR